jgi:hypothetical protein
VARGTESVCDFEEFRRWREDKGRSDSLSSEGKMERLDPRAAREGMVGGSGGGKNVKPAGDLAPA